MKLFIIDDDDLIHSLYKLYLKQMIKGFEAESFHNGLDAIRIVENWAKHEMRIPDLILLDINMPIMDGIEFLDRFELVAPSLQKVPSIFILSSGLLEHEFLKNRKYVAEVFSKPMTSEIVKKMISIS